MMTRTLPALARGMALLALAAAACGDDTPTRAMLALPGGEPGDDFYALPFPNDLWRKPEGGLDLSQFPTNSLIVDTYRMAAETLDGFGMNQPIYARFEAALDPASLPDAAGSLEEASSVYLVDVDPDSPARGTRTPIVARFRAEPTQTLGGNHLVVRPYPGFSLDSGTTYAMVVTTRVRDANGDAIAAPDSWRSLTPDAAAAYEPLLAFLDEPGGDDRDDVATAAVFTTQTATAIMPAIRATLADAPAPVATNVIAAIPNPAFTVFTGNYMAPNFQTGDVPYRNVPTGQIEIGADGRAIIQRMEPMRFALSVPTGAVPATGFPIAIYQHGTGGDHTSFVDDGTAEVLTQQGIAVISTDQVLHGPRNPGGDPQLDFFNIANPYAVRDNVVQGAADAWNQLALAKALRITDGNRQIKLDPARVFFFGHSQGGVTGPGFVAFEPTVKGAVFSGTGGVFYLALLYKTKPLDVPSLLSTFLRDDPIDEDNPSLGLVQMWFERADSVNYAPLMVRAPSTAIDGAPIAPRNIYQTEGFVDSYTPNPAIEAFAVAIGGDLVSTPDQQDIPGLALRGRGVVAPPIANNINGATAALAQFDQQQGSDGHFVTFDIAAARRQAAEFLGTLARTGTATVVP